MILNPDLLQKKKIHDTEAISVTEENIHYIKPISVTEENDS
jgi:hypothetical protein